MRAVEDTPTAALLDGRYQLGQCVGQGASARVYRAEDVLLGRTVAIKLIEPGAEPLTSPARIQNEIAVLASLMHPSLVQLFDARVLPGSPGYLVMEFIDGPTLAQRLYEGPLTTAEVADLAKGLASALHVVHEAGVVHRDLKPGNILLAPPTLPGGRRTVKLADFGVAYLLDSTRVTSPGTVVGTAAYLSPEQVRGGPADRPGDIYALGLVLLEALTGERPYPQATGIGAVMARLIHSPEIPERLPEEWRELLTRMTAMEPAVRPTALEVAQAAETLPASTDVFGAGSASGDGESSRAPLLLAPTQPIPATEAIAARTSYPIPAPRPGRRRRATLIGAAAAAVLCVSAGLWAGGLGAVAEPTYSRHATTLPSAVTPAEEAVPVDPVDVVSEPVSPQAVVEQDEPADSDKEAEQAAKQAEKQAEEQREAQQEAEEEAQQVREEGQKALENASREVGKLRDAKGND